MDRDTMGELFGTGTVVALLLGVGLVVLGGPIMGGLGAVVLILGILGIMPSLRFTMLTEQ